MLDEQPQLGFMFAQGPLGFLPVSHIVDQRQLGFLAGKLDHVCADFHFQYAPVFGQVPPDAWYIVQPGLHPLQRG